MNVSHKPTLTRHRFVLWITAHPVYDISNPGRPEARKIAWILENLLIAATLSGPSNISDVDFTRDAINWARSLLAKSGDSIGVVAGDSANESAARALGVTYSADPQLRNY